MKYCLNNFVFPLTFTILYCLKIFYFLQDEGIFPVWQIVLFLLSFLAGNSIFIFLAFTYFFKTNKNITKLYGIQSSEQFLDKTKDVRRNLNGERNPHLIKESRDWYVETYLVTPFRIRLVRSVRHYKKEMLKAVLRQNHRAAFLFQILTIISLVSLGLFSNFSAFEIPASASIFLLFTMFLMLFSSFYAWFRGWSTVIFFTFLISFNYLHKLDFLSIDNRAYGLNYDTTKASYHYDNFKQIDIDYDKLTKDRNATLEILNKWKAKNTFADPSKKPKMVFVNVSGGGSRSSLWTFYTLQYADSILNGKLLNQTQLITGSSGGMVGAAYIRELYLRKQEHKIKSFYGSHFRTNIAKDVLNPIAFTIATSEWLFPLKSFKVDNRKYAQDRGYAFEQRLQENTGYVFDRRLKEYKMPEANSYIPMMIFSPSIVNDGRKMLISSQGISYITQNAKTDKTNYNKLFDAVEYGKLFEDQDPGNTLFTSVLRMSATFPYISPVVSLPSEPRIEIMDAGLRDNYGLETTFRFIKTFNDWIAENTSGIIIIQIRDKHKNIPIDENPSQTLAEALSRPLGSFYGNLFQVQDFNQNQQIQMADLWSKSPIDIIDFQLRNELNDRISLSWHLTNKEKKKVFASLFLPENQKALKKLGDLLK
jgi:hypothetical protein